MPSVIRRMLRRLRVLSPIAPTPTRDDVEHYMRLREAGRRLNDELLGTIPTRAMDDIGEALGIVRGRTFIFDSEEISDVFTDCCFYDWMEGGRNLVRKYAEENPPPEDPDEREVLSAMLRARYTIFDIKECVPETGVRVVDGSAGRELFILDMGFSRSSWMEGTMSLAARILPVGEFWMTSGCALPLTDLFPFALLKNLSAADVLEPRGLGALLEEPRTVLTIIRSCIESGAADHVRYSTDFGREDDCDINDDFDLEDGFDLEDEFEPQDVLVFLSGLPPVRRALPREPSRNSACSCGSGRKYKRCCGRGKRARAS